VDLVLRRGAALIPIEIKSAALFSPDFRKAIESFRSNLGLISADGLVLHDGKVCEHLADGRPPDLGSDKRETGAVSTKIP
jgi:hypothetical protein